MFLYKHHVTVEFTGFRDFVCENKPIPFICDFSRLFKYLKASFQMIIIYVIWNGRYRNEKVFWMELQCRIVLLCVISPTYKPRVASWEHQSLCGAASASLYDEFALRQFSSFKYQSHYFGRQVNRRFSVGIETRQTWLG